ncbi:MAG TPA: formate dehydrogenase accessory sulfurtransferase FdhD [Candidatus Sulfotelmatobacter sp.]|nr:formate dehydrogenase accessory sulfurtransferase FdhD [Candidatus Sulfotelmatobacter sp.]
MSVRVMETPIQRFNGGHLSNDKDFLAREEPMEIRIEGQSIAIVMRTPGEDRELAAGFLVTEGVAQNAADILEIAHCPHCPTATTQASAVQDSNTVDVRLRNRDSLDMKRLTRHVFTSSSCGICSKATIEAVRQQFPPLKDGCKVDANVLLSLPQSIMEAQDTFKRTGGLHACGLFDLEGNLLVLREDVGRHNALDKVIGWALLEGNLPLRRHILLLSGRTSFEMLQKALAAGIPIVAGISAPSSLAVMFAQDSGQTLVGFLRDERMNIYAGAHRVHHLKREREDCCV